MLRHRFVLPLCLSFSLAAWPAVSEPPDTDPDVARGIQQVDDGDYAAAVITLDGATRRLAGEAAKARELSQAYLYLGIAYIGLGQEAAARARFREALTESPDLSLSPEKYPPKVINALEAAREEIKRAPAAAPSPAAPAAGKKKGGGGKTLLIVGGLAAAGGGVALAAGGGGGGGTSTSSSSSLKTENFGPITLSEADCCRDFNIFVEKAGSLNATLTWTNGGGIFEMELDDPANDYATVAVANQTGNTEARLEASVGPLANGNPKQYSLSVYFDGRGVVASDSFTIRVTHP